jgi:hypothetical protein
MSSEAIKRRIEELKQLEQSPYPTPPVGTTVVWFNAARQNPERPFEDAVPGIVNRIDGPGRVTLVVFPPFGMPSHKRSSHHVSHPIHLQRANSVSIDSGSWDYPQGTKPPKEHYHLHLAELTAQRAEAERNLAHNDAVTAKTK